MYSDGNFGVIHTLNISHDNHSFKFEREIIEAVLNSVFHFISFGLLGRGHVGVSEPAWRVHFFAIVTTCVGFERRGRTALLAA